MPSLAVAVLAVPLLAPRARAALDARAHAALVAGERLSVEVELRSWRRLPTPGFALYYQPGQEVQARIVRAALERFYPEVARDFGLPLRGTAWPAVVVSPALMAADVAGPLADPPLGAYYRGALWFLDPADVVGPGAGAAAYERYGPVPHELTHLADDILSGGTTPRWLDEGIAQYEEWRLNGYVWVDAANLFDQPLYSWTRLTQDFDALPNVALAYRQALAATRAICARGAGACVRVLHDLAAGLPADAAIAAVAGPRVLRALEAGRAWLPGLGPRPGEAAGPPP